MLRRVADRVLIHESEDRGALVAGDMLSDIPIPMLDVMNQRPSTS